MTERWQPIPGFPGYEASDQGRVRSIERTVTSIRDGRPVPVTYPSRVLRVFTDGRGPYRRHQVQMRRNGRTVVVRVHRAVLLAFVGEPLPGQVACHNNGDGTDNRLVNLRWDTQAANHADTVAHGHFKPIPRTRGEHHPTARLTEDAVRAIRSSGASHRALARAHGTTPTNIAFIRQRKTWAHVA